MIEPSILCTLGKKKKKKLILYWLDQLVHHLLTKHAHCNLTPSCQVQKGGRPAKTRSLFFFFFCLFLLSCIEEEKKAKLFQTLHEKLKNASPPASFSTSTHRHRCYCYPGLTHRIWDFINLYLHLIAQCHGCTITTTSLFGSL